MQDNEIIELFFARSELAISETSSKYNSYMFVIANNVLNSESDSSEVLNDSYMRLWNSIPPTRPTSLKAFLAKIVRNLSINKFNSKKNKNQFEVEPLNELENYLFANGNGESSLESKELTKIIDEFLEKENKINRIVFLRRYWFFDKISLISQKTGFSENKIKSLLMRMRKKLKIKLIKEGVSL